MPFRLLDRATGRSKHCHFKKDHPVYIRSSTNFDFLNGNTHFEHYIWVSWFKVSQKTMYHAYFYFHRNRRNQSFRMLMLTLCKFYFIFLQKMICLRKLGLGSLRTIPTEGADPVGQQVPEEKFKQCFLKIKIFFFFFSRNN